MTPPIHLALVVEAPQISRRAVAEVAAALQRQLIRDVAPIWEVQATLDAFLAAHEVDDDTWDTVLAINTTEPGSHYTERDQALLAFEPRGDTGTTLSWRHRPPSGRRVAVVAAGTSDLPVADECRLTLESLGHEVQALTDVGVAGLHRLLAVLEDLERAEVLVAVAGMEGALPTVLAGLVPQPLIAVPTSVGYGTAFEGQTALLSMMTSSGRTVSSFVSASSAEKAPTISLSSVDLPTPPFELSSPITIIASAPSVA